MTKRILILFFVFCGIANAQGSLPRGVPTAHSAAALLPTCGVEVDGVNNSTQGFERNIVKPPSFNATFATSFSTTSATGDGTNTTVALTSDPTSQDPGWVAGRSYVTLSSFSDGAANGVKKVVSFNASQVVVASAYNGSTSGGTVKTALMPDLAEQASHTDPSFGCEVQKMWDAASGGLGSKFYFYPTVPGQNADGSWFIGSTGSSGKRLIRTSDSAIGYGNGTLSGDGNNPNADPLDPNIFWFQDTDFPSDNTKLKKGTCTAYNSCTPSTITDFGNHFGIGGSAGSGEGGAVLGSNGKTLLPYILKVDASNTEFGGYYPDTQTKCGTHTEAVDFNHIDNIKVLPDCSHVVDYNNGAGAGNTQGVQFYENTGTRVRQISTANMHLGATITTTGKRLVLIDSNNSDVPCPSGSGNGWAMVDGDTGTKTCLVSRENISATATKLYDVAGHFGNCFAAVAGQGCDWAVVEQMGGGRGGNGSLGTNEKTMTGTASGNGTTVTFTASNTHGRTNGQSVIISGCATSGYNGTFTVGGASGSTFTYTNATTGSGTGCSFHNSPDIFGGGMTPESGATSDIFSLWGHGGVEIDACWLIGTNHCWRLAHVYTACAGDNCNGGSDYNFQIRAGFGSLEVCAPAGSVPPEIWFTADMTRSGGSTSVFRVKLRTRLVC